MKKTLIVAITLAMAGVSGAVIAKSFIAHDHSHPHLEDAAGHGGGLDQCGGHYNRKTGVYHYHRTPKC